MLVISRRRGQRILIGDGIEIIVTEVHRSSVKLGIRAPRGVGIVRAEIVDDVVSSDESLGARAAATGEPTPDEPSPPGGASSDGEQDDERDRSG